MTKLHNTNSLSATKINLLDNQTLKQNPNHKCLTTLNFRGKYKEVAFLVEKNLIFIGLDLPVKKTWDPFFSVDFFELGAVVGNYIKTTKITDIQLEGSSIEINSQMILDFSLGFEMSIWKFTKYQKKSTEKNLQNYRIFTSKVFSRHINEETINLFNSLKDGIKLTRSIIDDTPEAINPKSIINIIEDNFGEYQNLKIQNYNSKDLEKMNMNCILAVGKASQYSPILSHISYKPRNKVTKKICFVGKGVTYDSGGLNVKTGEYMKTMKCDMGGSATILGILKTISVFNLESTEVHFINPFVENMIAANSYKADDIITSFSGQTIEVHNTDAEGRLILADALSFATTLDPDYVIDMATLTGAVIMAISEYYTGIMGNDFDLINSINNHFIKNQEYSQITQLPIVLEKHLKGTISDLSNLSSIKQAGHSTAGIFLSYFVDQNNFRSPGIEIPNPKSYSWAHLDIAGSSYNLGKNKLHTKGSTGSTIRSLVSWLLEEDKKN